MEFTFSGELCARVCKYIEVPVTGATVLLYRADGEEVTKAVAARRKETFRVRSVADDGAQAEPDGAQKEPDGAQKETDGAQKEPGSQLLGEGAVDPDGTFDVTFDGTETDYVNDPLEIVVRVTSIGPHEIEPVTVSVTTEQPRWKESDGRITGWEHCFARHEWCTILESAGLWVVAGRVTDCETEEPLEELTVTAFDADIIQHDELGSDSTNADGEYVIYYDDADVERVPFGLAPVELTGGPDLYFHVESAGGTLLLEEETSDGRQVGRENAGRCECIDHCVDFEGPGPDIQLFTHVGRFNVFQDLAADGTLVRDRGGLAGEGWGFFGSLPLVGHVPRTDPDTGDQVWYRFLYEDGDGTEHPLVGNLVDRVHLGFDVVSVAPLEIQNYYVVGDAPAPDPGLSPPPVYVEPTAGYADAERNGWVKVPDLNGTLSGDLLRFDTTEAPTIPGGVPTEPTPGAAPGSTPGGSQIEVIFETTTHSGSGDPDPTGGDIERQSHTAPLYVNNWEEVRTLDVVTFDDDGNADPVGCQVTDEGVVRYTADHEFLHSYSVSLGSQAAGGGGPGATWPNSLAAGNMNRDANPPGTTTGNADSIDLPAVYGGGPGSPGADYDAFADWPSCSYIARLHTRRALTNGEHRDDGDSTGAVNGVFYKG